MGTETENTAETTVAEPIALEPAVAVTPEEGAPTKAIVIVGSGVLPKGGKQLVIVSEARTPDADGAPQWKKDGYPEGADIYFRTDVATNFPTSAPEVITLGVDIQQFSFQGFTRALGYVCVGPAHPAYAAANIAYQRGATDIKIVGLSDSEKEHLKKFFDVLPTDPVAPAQVKVSFA